MAAATDLAAEGRRLRLATDALPGLRAPHDALVVVATHDAILRATARLPPRAQPATRLQVRAGDDMHVAFAGDALEVTLPSSSAPVVAAWAKLHRAGARVVIFDRSRWHAIGERAASALPSLQIADQTR